MQEFHEWRVDAGATAGYCEMSVCGGPREYRLIYTFQQLGMPIPEIRTWSVCAQHARVWAQEKGAAIPETGIAIAPALAQRSLADRN